MIPPTTSPRMPFVALAAAAGAHLAVLAAVIGTWTAEPLVDEIRAIEVEVAAVAEPAPPQPEAPPQAQPEALPSQAAPYEPEPPVVTEAPPIDPSLIPLLEPPPQLVLQTPAPPPKPVTPRPAAPRPTPPAVSAPAPPSALPPALTAPAPPAAAARQPTLDPRYIDRLAAAIERVRDYPVAARRRGEQGRVTLGIVVATDGRLLSADVVGSSGHEALDKAALAMVRRAALPPLTPGLGAESASFTIPIVFAVR